MNHSHRPLALFFAVLCLLITTASHSAANGHYRWTNDKGQVQYSDRPPPGVESEFIKFATGRRSAAAAVPSADTQVQKVQQKLPTMVQVAPKKDPALCKQAKHNLKAMDGARVRMTDTDGSKRFLTEQEREGQRENARRFIKINC